jgi:uncharacterized protein (TIGR02145 family)
MKNRKTNFIMLMLLSVLCFTACNNADQSTIKIGNQEWTNKNLNVSTFKNGDAIPEVKTDEAWVKAGEEGEPAWCYYNNDPKNGNKYGRLYNWYAVTDPRGLAPSGWHIPSDAEWTTLTDNLGDVAAGHKMKSQVGWRDNGNGSNRSGFSGLPGGGRFFNGAFNNIGNNGGWWSSTEASTGSAWFRYLDYINGIVSRNDYYGKTDGFSVRCLRD